MTETGMMSRQGLIIQWRVGARATSVGHIPAAGINEKVALAGKAKRRMFS